MFFPNGLDSCFFFFIWCESINETGHILVLVFISRFISLIFRCLKVTHTQLLPRDSPVRLLALSSLPSHLISFVWGLVLNVFWLLNISTNQSMLSIILEIPDDKKKLCDNSDWWKYSMVRWLQEQTKDIRHGELRVCASKLRLMQLFLVIDYDILSHFHH